MAPSPISTPVFVPNPSVAAAALVRAALRAAMLRCWSAARRHAERPDRVVPYC